MPIPNDNTLEWLQEIYENGPYLALLHQLKKDYERANLEFFLDLEGGKPLAQPAELLQGLRESVYFLLMERFNAYLNLMYAADVPEQEFRDITPLDPVEAAGQVARILLRREWQKIEWRSRFGPPPGN